MRDSAFVILLPLVYFACGTGCSEPDRITKYRVPKQESAVETREMLVAVTEKKGNVYFFKLVGPSVQLAPIREQVKRFLDTVQFSPENALTWQLPPGWSERKGTGMRLATLVMDQRDRPPLEMAISTLRQTNPDWDAYLTSNLNRWRRQLGLPPLNREMATSAFEKLGAQGTTIYFAQLQSSNGKNIATTFPIRAERSTEGFDASVVRGTPPADWKPRPITGMRKACFGLQTNDQALEVTVIPAGGDLLANVNRWRGQLKLKPIDQQQLNEQSTAVTAGNLGGKYIAILGKTETILAAVFPRVTGGSWFVKLRGDPKLAETQRESFQSFLASLRFGPTFQ